MRTICGEPTDSVPVFPLLMFFAADRCRDKAIECISQTRGSRYMLSAGCEIPAATTDVVFRAFREAPLTTTSP